jgi:hypothetical protein
MSKHSSSCFTYKVEMVIQVLAENEMSARDFLDKNGGYVVSREVALVDSMSVYESKD